MARLRATVVVPTFNEARSLPLLSERLQKVLDAEDLDWEVLFVDDGSSDDSFAEIEKLHRTDGRFKCLRFSRNFGSHVAISAGLEHAFGDIALVITSDLEEPPEAIADLLKAWRDGLQIVWGIRARAATRGLGRIASFVFHRLFAWLADFGPGQSEIGGGLFLVDAVVLTAIRQFSERNRNIVGMLLWAGFKQGRLTYQPANRKFGRSKWSLAKKVRLALDTFVGFSVRPLRVMLGLGVAFVTIGVAGLVGWVLSLAMGGSTSNWGLVTGVVSTGAVVAGVQLMGTGLVGEYVWRGLDEARARPLYVLMERLGLDEAQARVDGGRRAAS